MKKFTDKFIQSLKPQNMEYCLREGHGFTIRVLPSGTKTFQYIFTHEGKRRRLNLGQYPFTTLAEAREKYLAAASKVAKGHDPSKIEEPEVPSETLTVSGLVDGYIEHISIHLVERSVRQQKRTLEHDVLPIWAARPACEIRRKDAIALVEGVAKRAPGQARNIIKTGRSLYTYATDRELCESNPFIRVSRAVPSTAPRSVERVLSDSEIVSAWKMLLNSYIGRIMLLVLVTGQRPGEVCGMKWQEIDGNWWTVPWQRIKTEVRKDLPRKPRNHRVFLTPLALSLLPTAIDEYVFPANGRGRGVNATGGIRPATLSHFLTDNDYLGLQRWSPQDLRRTARTGMAKIGVLEKHAEMVLNHMAGLIVRIYDLHQYDEEKKAALLKWSSHIDKILHREMHDLSGPATVSSVRGEIADKGGMLQF